MRRSLPSDFEERQWFGAVPCFSCPDFWTKTRSAAARKADRTELCRWCVCATLSAALSLWRIDKIVDLTNRGAFVHVPISERNAGCVQCAHRNGDDDLNILADLLIWTPLPLYAMIRREEEALAGRPRRMELPVQSLPRRTGAPSGQRCAVRHYEHAERAVFLIVAVAAHREEKHAINTHTHSEHREILDTAAGGQAQPRGQILRRHLGNCMERLEKTLEDWMPERISRLNFRRYFNRRNLMPSQTWMRASASSEGKF